MAKKIRKFFRRLGENRTLLLGVVFLAMFAVLIGRLFILQVVHGEEYADNFELQITKTRTLESTRGNIYDRNGKLIAGNKVSYSVTIEDNGTYNTTKERILSLNAELYRLCKLIRANGDSIEWMRTVRLFLQVKRERSATVFVQTFMDRRKSTI